MAEPENRIDPSAVVDCLIKDDLAKYLLDSDTANELVEWIHKETGLPKHYLKPALRVFGIIAVRGIKKATSWGGDLLSERIRKVITKLPFYDQLAVRLLDLKRRLDENAEDRQLLEDIASGKRPFHDAEFSKKLTVELRAQLEALTQIAGLEAKMSEKFDQVLDCMKPQPPLQIGLIQPEGACRHLFNAQRVPFVGRKEELAALNKFLYADSLLNWWIITGSGGLGKSRLALELALRNGNGWRCGFLPQRHSFNAWHSWQPEGPTLIFIDKAKWRVEDVRHIIATLGSRSEPLDWPVRILLMEREARGIWWDRLQPFTADRAVVREVLYADPMELTTMSPEEIWACICHIVTDKDRAKTSRESILGDLQRIDVKSRPLYALLAAEALAEGGGIESGTAGDMLRMVLMREESEIWDAAGLTSREKNLLTLVTMTSGLPIAKLKDVSTEDLLPPLAPGPDQMDLDRFTEITGAPEAEVLPPLQPDLIGEYFVLERLKPTGPLDGNFARTMQRLAWITNPDGYTLFLSKAVRDFDGHPTLKVLSAKDPDPEYDDCWTAQTPEVIDQLFAAGRTQTSQRLYEELSDMAGSTDGKASARRMQAEAAAILVERYGETGQFTEANRHLEDLFTLSQDHPGEYVLLEPAAKASHRLVSTYAKAGRLEAAEAVVARMPALARLHPSHRVLALRTADAYHQLVRGYSANLRPAEASRSLDALKNLSLSYESDPLFRSLHSRATSRLAECYSQLGNFEEAQNRLVELKVVSTEHPDEPDHWISAVYTASNLVGRYGKTDEIEDTLDVLGHIPTPKGVGFGFGSWSVRKNIAGATARFANSCVKLEGIHGVNGILKDQLNLLESLKIKNGSKFDLD